MYIDKIILAILLLTTMLQVIWLTKELKRIKDYVDELRYDMGGLIHRLQKDIEIVRNKVGVDMEKVTEKEYMKIHEYFGDRNIILKKHGRSNFVLMKNNGEALAYGKLDEILEKINNNLVYPVISMYKVKTKKQRKKTVKK